jgi:hypothetical protein
VHVGYAAVSRPPLSAVVLTIRIYNGVAVETAERAHRTLPWSFLGPPAVVGASSAVMGVAATLRPEMGAADSRYHLQHEPWAYVVQTIQAAPRSTPQPLDLGAVPDAGLLLAVVLVLAPDRVLVWIVDAVGRVLACVTPLR